MMVEDRFVSLVGEETTCWRLSLSTRDWSRGGRWVLMTSMLKSPSRTRFLSLAGGMASRLDSNRLSTVESEGGAIKQGTEEATVF